MYSCASHASRLASNSLSILRVSIKVSVGRATANPNGYYHYIQDTKTPCALASIHSPSHKPETGEECSVFSSHLCTSPCTTLKGTLTHYFRIRRQVP